MESFAYSWKTLIFVTGKALDSPEKGNVDKMSENATKRVRKISKNCPEGLKACSDNFAYLVDAFVCCPCPMPARYKLNWCLAALAGQSSQADTVPPKMFMFIVSSCPKHYSTLHTLKQQLSPEGVLPAENQLSLRGPTAIPFISLRKLYRIASQKLFGACF